MPTVTRTALGQTVRLRSRATSLAVTVLGVRVPVGGSRSDVPLSGDRFAGVLVDVRDVGAAGYSSSEWADVGLYGSDGSAAWHAFLGSGVCTDEGQPSALAPGDDRHWCVPFELPARVRPAEVTVAPDGGFGLHIGEWMLPAAHVGGSTR
jgi:hypothetical protein